MTANIVSFAAIEQLLQRLKFVEAHTTGNHRLYENLSEDVILVLPTGNRLSLTHVVAIRKPLIERGMIDPEPFDELLADLIVIAQHRPH